MGAKSKLNSAYINGALVIAGMVGLITGSCTVFAVVCIVLIASSIVAGDIRSGGRSGRRHSGSPRSHR